MIKISIEMDNESHVISVDEKDFDGIEDAIACAVASLVRSCDSYSDFDMNSLVQRFCYAICDACDGGIYGVLHAVSRSGCALLLLDNPLLVLPESIKEETEVGLFQLRAGMFIPDSEYQALLDRKKKGGDA